MPDDRDSSHPYRAAPDVGALISSGISALAKGFAQIAEAAVIQAEPKPELDLPPHHNIIEHLTRYLKSRVRAKRDIVLHARYDFYRNVLIIAIVDGDARYEEHIRRIDALLETHSSFAAMRAVERIADRINRDLR